MNTRYLYVYPLKNKTAKTVYTALKNFTDNNDICSISSDFGNEFSNKLVEDLFKEKNIQFIVFNKSDKTNNKKNTTSIIERVNRSIR